MGGLFDIMDNTIAHELGVDLYNYIKIIDHKCTEEEVNNYYSNYYGGRC
jgi:hypothetical protein